MDKLFFSRPSAPVAVLGICFALSTASYAGGAKAEGDSVPITSSSEQALKEYAQANEFLDNIQTAPATAALQRAIALDPHFASAHALLATMIPAVTSAQEIQLALADSKKLPEAERVQIESIAAGIRGDDARARKLRKKVAELKPRDWRAHVALGGEAMGDRTWDRAVKEMKIAIALNPKAAAALNLLGYSYMMQTHYDEAIATLRKYAELVPNDANPHDSLAEALLNAGKLDESEAEFTKATSLDAHFALSWLAIAEIRELRGDWAGAATALDNETAADERIQDKLTAQLDRGALFFLQGNEAEGNAAIEAAMKEGAMHGLPMLGTGAVHSRLFFYRGKHADSLASARADMARIDAATLDEGTKDIFRHQVILSELRALAAMGQKEDAQTSLAHLEKVLQASLKQAFPASQLANGRGLAKLVQGDKKGAVAEMKKCLTVDVICRYDLVRALEASGDKAGAANERTRILGLPIRTIDYAQIWTQLGGQTTHVAHASN